jgi:5-methylcytosine-specific restriction endonuclease McrA
MTDRSCPFCGVRMEPRRRVQCGAPSCQTEYENKRHRDWQRSYKEKNGEWQAYSMPSRPKRKSNAHCIDCGKPVRWGRTQETRCREHSRQYSRKLAAECRRQEREQALAEYNSRPARALRKLTVAAAGVPANFRWVLASGQCHRCGEWFVCRVTNSSPQYCSKRCYGQEAKDRRRAREAGVDIEPGQRWRIYARDNYTCQLCLKVISRKAIPESGLDFTIDHIIPLARGGAHAEHNWQTAHRICNALKGARLNWTPEEVPDGTVTTPQPQ